MDKLSQIRSDRRTVYGDPKENHQGIASMWAPLLQRWWLEIKKGQPIPPHVVALLMAGLKLDRMRLVYHEDNYDDIANYLLFAKEWQKDHHDGEVQPERVYVSGPFSAGTSQLIEANIQAASDAGLAIMKKGHLAHVPHAATCRWHNQLDYEDFMRLDMSLLETWATGLLYLAPSPGADRELARAKELNLKIYHSVAEIQPHRNNHVANALRDFFKSEYAQRQDAYIFGTLLRKINNRENLTDPVGFSWYVPVSPGGETVASSETQPAGDGMGSVDRASSETSPSRVLPTCECPLCAQDRKNLVDPREEAMSRETLTVEKNREMSLSEADKRFMAHQPVNLGDLT